MNRIRHLVSFTAIMLVASACTISPKVTPKHFSVERRWVRDTVAGQHLGYFQLHRFQPILIDHLVIQANAFNSLVAYNQADGSEVWRLLIDGGVEGSAEIKGERMYFGASDGYFYSIDYRTGKVIWTHPIRSEGLAEPTVEGDTVYFVAGNNVAYALDAETGKQKWIYTRRDNSSLSIRGGSKPQVVGGSVFVGFTDGYLVSLSKKDGQPQWEKLINRNRRFRDVDAHPVIDGQRLYIPSYDGGLYCLDSSNGEIIWTLDEGGYSAVTLTEDMIYYATTSNKMVALDKKSGKRVWQQSLGENLATRPVVYRGLLVFGEYNGALRVLDARTGESVSSYHPGLGVTSTPTIHMDSGNLYFMSKGANLFALRLTWKQDQRVWPWESL